MLKFKLHIFKDEHVYNIALLKFFESKYDLIDHRFIFLKKDSGVTKGMFPMQIFHYPGFMGLIKAMREAYRSEKIYFHSLPMGPQLLLWTLFFPVFRKAAWIYWGADIYAYRNRYKSLKHFIYHICRKIIIRQLPVIAGFLEGDFKLVQKNYTTKAVYHQVVYPVPTGFDMLDQMQIKPRNDSPALKVLLGNSASKTNLHLEALEMLRKFSSENIQVICPLSYGIKNQEYFQEVVRVGKEILGDRFTPLTEFLDPGKYAEMLAGIDVAIMNHNRQEALGNIISLLYLGKKVYLKPETSSFEYFNHLNVKVFNINDLITGDYKVFSAIDREALNHNALILKNELSEANYIKWWGNIINLT
jgi:hypothetical protein